MAVSTKAPPDRAVFWFGCNLVRHGEVIRTTARLLEAVGVAAETAGGPSHCCGATQEASARITEGMGRRTVESFNAMLAGPAEAPAAETQPRPAHSQRTDANLL